MASQLFTLLFSPSSRGSFSFSPLTAIRMVSSAYLRLLLFLPTFVIPTCDSPTLAFHMIYPAFKLNKQSDNIQPWCTPFPVLSQSIFSMSGSNCFFWTCVQVSQEAGKVDWYFHLLKNFLQFVVIHTVKGFSVVNEAEVDVLLELPCFLNDPTNVGNLISGSSVFSKSSLNIWKFLVHILLKPSLKDFEHNLVHGKWVQQCSNLNILWHCSSLGLEWKLTFPSPMAAAVFQICWHIEFSTFTASSFRIWNSSTGIPSPLLALFIVMLPKVH